MNHRGKITLLVFFLSVCATAALLHFVAKWGEETVKPAEVYATVRAQIAAFRRNDFPTAYLCAAASFRQQWTLEDFSSMVVRDFSKMLTADGVEFGTLQQHGQRAILEVYFIDKNGMAVPCIYSLTNDTEGWKVDGVRWVKGWPNGQRMRGIRS